MFEILYLPNVESYIVLHQKRLAKNQSVPIGEETKKHFFEIDGFIFH